MMFKNPFFEPTPNNHRILVDPFNYTFWETVVDQCIHYYTHSMLSSILGNYTLRRAAYSFTLVELLWNSRTVPHHPPRLCKLYTHKMYGKTRSEIGQYIWEQVMKVDWIGDKTMTKKEIEAAIDQNKRDQNRLQQEEYRLLEEKKKIQLKSDTSPFDLIPLTVQHGYQTGPWGFRHAYIAQDNFVGFLYEDGTVWAVPVRYGGFKTSIGSVLAGTLNDLREGRVKEMKATHVVLRRN